MSGRLCCYKLQQHSELLAQFVFKVSAFRFNMHEDACTTHCLTAISNYHYRADPVNTDVTLMETLRSKGSK